jgi:hypothetical protein
LAASGGQLATWGIAGGLVIDHGPDRAGTVAELWPSGDYPTAVTETLRDEVWCDLAGNFKDERPGAAGAHAEKVSPWVVHSPGRWRTRPRRRPGTNGIAQHGRMRNLGARELDPGPQAML